MDKNLVEFPKIYTTIQQVTAMSILLGRTLPDDLTKPKQKQGMICKPSDDMLDVEQPKPKHFLKAP